MQTIRGEITLTQINRKGGKIGDANSDKCWLKNKQKGLKQWFKGLTWLKKG